MFTRLLELLRYRFFWLSDVIKGTGIRKHFLDIETVMDNYPEQMMQERLTNVLLHAKKTTKFYAVFFACKSIDDFPVINKNIIRENTDQFISDQFSTEQLIPSVTSGSTGTPFKVYHNADKKNRNTADTIYFAKRGGYTLGSKLYYFKIWSANNKKADLLKWVQNIVSVDVIKLNETCLPELLKIKENKLPVNFLGYSSAFETVCKFLDKENVIKNKVTVNSIITMSESLNEYTKTSMEKYFSCPALSRYSNIENGIVAQQTLDCKDAFVVNVASYYIEIFDISTDTLLPIGQLGRIVITDYFNYGMPLVRYDSGDLGSLDYIILDGERQLVLSKIEGRKLDQIYDTSGNLLSSFIVYKNMWKYTEINQYQFVQVNKNTYQFKICMEGDFIRADELANEFKEFLGADAIFSVEYVKEIPLLDSGKRKKVVNLMNS